MAFTTISRSISALIKSARLQNRRNDEVKILFAKHLAATSATAPLGTPFQDVEFSVFSQFGDDGIIQHLIGNLDIQNNLFIEFGVEDYEESNTRFLLLNNNWSGLVMDASRANVDKIKSAYYFWKHDLKCSASFVTRENINELISSHGISGGIGLLHIDIDGMDYWVWQSMEIVSPAIVIIEYNSVFGGERPVTVPYDPAFDRFEAHFSGLYAGCSLPALEHLGNTKGYSLIGCNSAGNNAYFIRNELCPTGFKPRTSSDAFVLSKFRESRDENGSLNFLSGNERNHEIRGMPVVNVVNEKIEKLGSS